MEENKLEQDFYNIGENLKATKLLKANSLINARVEYKNSRRQLSVIDKKVMNFLFTILQQQIRTKKDKPKAWTIVSFPLDLYKNLIDDSPKWRQNLIKSISRLEEDGVLILRNYFDIDSGKKIDWEKTRLVNNPKFIINTKARDKQAYCEISFTKVIANSCWQKSEYTHLLLTAINSFESKYALALYEKLVSSIQYIVNVNSTSVNGNEVILEAEAIETIFGQGSFISKQGFKNYLTNVIGFEKTVIPDLRRQLDFSYEIQTKNKRIIFRFSRDEMERFKTRKTDLTDKTIEAFNDLVKGELTHSEDESNSYTIKSEEIDQKLFNFLTFLRKNYAAKPLLLTEDEKRRYGDGKNLAISHDGTLFYVDDVEFDEKGWATRKKVVRYAKKKKALLYLYTKRYDYFKEETEERFLQNNATVLQDSVSAEFAKFLNKSFVLPKAEMSNIDFIKTYMETKNIGDLTDGNIYDIISIIKTNDLFNPDKIMVVALKNTPDLKVKPEQIGLEFQNLKVLQALCAIFYQS